MRNKVSSRTTKVTTKTDAVRTLPDDWPAHIPKDEKVRHILVTILEGRHGAHSEGKKAKKVALDTEFSSNQYCKFQTPLRDTIGLCEFSAFYWTANVTCQALVKQNVQLCYSTELCIFLFVWKNCFHTWTWCRPSRQSVSTTHSYKSYHNVYDTVMQLNFRGGIKCLT